ncbi:MAG: hypothetical protein LH475_04305 [Cryobacterium sp.]|uniref:hypothetical protein n=1 Tax=unclassified Cryobacterium TaxID=2649013 RepID=UPI001A266986|nr:MULTISPECIES: hypothetical protein [unclassified Cryobacterium]MCY7403841.1 hypothetical protein [Cryobacterium sp.]MEC5154246.1 hypothetical protein [Cryobacterium sp. CAN_C3]
MTTNSPAVSPSGEKHDIKEFRAEARHARAELASTLDAIEYKFNLPKQLRIKRRRLAHALRQLGEDSPAALAGIAAGAATVVGVIVWFGASAVAKNR